MATTADIPSMIEAINRSSRTLLALASRQAILNNQDVFVFIFFEEDLKLA